MIFSQLFTVFRITTAEMIEWNDRMGIEMCVRGKGKCVVTKTIKMGWLDKGKKIALAPLEFAIRVIVS